MARFPAPPIAKVGDRSPTLDPRIVPGLVAEGLQLDRGRDDLFESKTLDNLVANQVNRLVSWGARTPRMVVIEVAIEFIGAAAMNRAPIVNLSWGIGSAAFPVARFQRSGPIVLFADSVNVEVENQDLLTWKTAASVGPVDGALPPARPFFRNPANTEITIPAAGNQAFSLSPYTRRFKVGRFPSGIFEFSHDRAREASIAAGAIMPWEETGSCSGVIVFNTSAAPADFTILEELAL